MKRKYSKKSKARERLIIGFDIETTPFSMVEPKTEIIGFYIYNYDIDIYFDTPQQAIDFILSSTKDITFVGHNIQFDLNIIFNKGRIDNPIIDLSRDQTIKYKRKFVFDSFNLHGEYPHFASLTYKKIYYRLDENNKKKKTSKNVNINFIDLFNFLKYSLEELMKSYTPELTKYKQQKIKLISLSGIVSEVKQFDFLRNRADIEATTKIYAENFYKIVKKGKKEIPVVSIASYSFNDLIETSGWNWENKTEYKRNWRPVWLQEIERQSYRGGIVYPNPAFLLKEIPNAFYYDINSLYAYVMSNLKVPVKFLEYLTDLNYNEIQSIEYVRDSYNNPNQFCLFYIETVTTEPILPTKIDGKLELPENTKVEGWYCENELYHALFSGINKKKLKDFKIKHLIKYKAKKNLFRKFVYSHYKTKLEIDKERLVLEEYKKTTSNYTIESLRTFVTLLRMTETNKKEIEFLKNLDEKLKNYDTEDIKTILEYDIWRAPERDKSKLIPNSSYGRFAMLKRVSFVIDKEENKALFMELRHANNGDEFIDSTGILDLNNQKYTIRRENGVLYLDTVLKVEAPKGCTIVASAISSGARAELMKPFDKTKTIYTDTDSQVRVDHIETSTELGGWKIEKSGTVTVFGKKWYKFDDKLKLKGLPKGAKQLTKEEYTKIKLDELEFVNKERKKRGLKKLKFKNDYDNYKAIYSYMRVIKPREAIRRNLIPYTMIKTIKKIKVDPDLLLKKKEYELQEKLKKEEEVGKILMKEHFSKLS